MGFIQIRKGRAWHRIRTWTRVPSVAVTMCGKRAHGETADTVIGLRRCQTCERVADAAGRETSGLARRVDR